MKEFINMVGNVTSFVVNVIFFPTWRNVLEAIRGFQKQSENGNTPKDGKNRKMEQKNGQKRLKEWRKVTLMKECVKPLHISCV